MTEQIQVWHFGLVAQIWAEFSNQTPELSYYERKIRQFGEPALDLACGTGRLLVPLGKKGIEIEGVDISEDMLAHCKRKATEEGLEIQLVQQPMHALDRHRQYGTIYICGSFGLAGSRDLDLQTLRRCYEHLLPGGALLFNVDVEYAYPEAWLVWLKEHRDALPEPLPEEGRRYQSTHGYELISRNRLLEVNPLEQSYVREMRVERWEEGKLTAEERRTLRGNMYLKNEVLAMLHIVGFQEIEVTGDYSEEPATADSEELNFVAKK